MICAQQDQKDYTLQKTTVKSSRGILSTAGTVGFPWKMSYSVRHEACDSI